MKRWFIILLTLILLLTLAACAAAPEDEEAPVPDNLPEEILPGKIIEDAPLADYHIGIVTWPQDLFEETEIMHRSAQALVAEFGAAEGGGMIRHISLPNDFEEDGETVTRVTAGLADDPLMKAIIISQPIPAEGTTAAFRKNIKALSSSISYQ
ncbi:MAG: DUF3798 domain-containing protein [Clostridiales bacterium]|jgi:ABC-type glycerol-3-phosphate transport system substrate-binding protein|nr:DUF3798 domain-containing protein [Clostridiales bacterium]